MESLFPSEPFKRAGPSHLTSDLKVQNIEIFKQANGNYRDGHDYFRKLTQSPCVMEVRAQEIVVHLMPRTNYGGELRKAVTVIQTLEGTNALGLEHPCLRGKKVEVPIRATIRDGIENESGGRKPPRRWKIAQIEGFALVSLPRGLPPFF